MVDPVEKAQEAVDKAEADLADVLAMKVEAEATLAEAQKARDQAVTDRDGPVHPHQDMIDRLAYIRSQADIRAGRHRKAADLTEKLGGDVADLESKSPLDAAMSRKTKRGTKRPAVKKAD